MMQAFPKVIIVGLIAGAAPGLFAADAQAQAAPRVGRALVSAAQPADAALQAGNLAAAEPLVGQAEAAAATDAERYIAAALRYRLEWLRLGQKPAGVGQDQTALVKALDALIANPMTPRAEKARHTYTRGQMAFAGRQYATAIDYLARSRASGLADVDVSLTSIRAKLDSGDVAGASTELDAVVGAQMAAGAKVPVDYYRLAIARANKARLAPVTVAWMNRYAGAYPEGRTWYEVLMIYGFQQDSVAKLDTAQKIDVFRLLRASGGLPSESFYLDYARTAQAAGLPLEAQAVLKDGLAKNKIPAASAEAKALGASLSRAATAAGTPVSLEARAATATDGKPASQAGDAYLSSGNDAKAAALYRTALQKGGVDADTINTRLGIALARSGDKAGAQAAFAAVKGGPRAEIASFWTTWLNGAPTA